MNAIESINYCSSLSPWQDVSVRRLAAGLFFSLLVHTSLALWLTQPVSAVTTTQPASPSQRVEMHLVGSKLVSVTKVAQGNLDHSKPLHEAVAPTLSEAPPVEEVTPTATEETYFSPEDVEKMAHVVEVEDLPLPENKKTPGGALYLKVLINELGNADKVDILTSTLPDEYVTTLIGSFYQARFSPALLAGVPVKSWRVIEIRFDLPDAFDS